MWINKPNNKKNNIIGEKKMFGIKMDSKGQVSGLLGLIAVVGVGGIILMQIYYSVLVSLPSTLSTNGTLQSVLTSFLPLFILAGVAGAVIAVLLFSFGGRR